MDDLKSQLKKTASEVFQKAQDLNINELEFALRNFWQIPGMNRSKNPIYGVMLFDRLSRVLKGMNYELIGPKYQLVITKAGQDSQNQRAILNGIQAVQAFCENPDQKIPFDYETKKREQTDASSELEKEYGLRLRMSEENKQKGLGFNWVKDTETQKTFRYRKRYSFKVPVKGLDSKEGSIHIDLSIYKEGTGLTFKTATFSDAVSDTRDTRNTRTVDKRFMNGPETYDIEIEFQPAGGKSIQETDLDQILDWMSGAIYKCIQMAQDSPIVMSVSQRQTVYEKYLKLVNKNSSKDSGPSRFVGANVYPMGIQNVLAGQEFEQVRIAIDKYAFTIKADGVRNLLFVDDEGKCYLIDMNHEVRSTGVQDVSKNCLLDIELINIQPTDRMPEAGNYKILAFDALFYNGKDIRTNPLFPGKPVAGKLPSYRYNMVELLISELSTKIAKESFYTFEAKVYYRTPYYQNTLGTTGKSKATKATKATASEATASEATASEATASETTEVTPEVTKKVETPKKVEVIEHESITTSNLKSLEDLIKLETEYKTQGKYPKDGLILTQMYDPYPTKSSENANTFSLKVKNLDQLSIDFLYRPTNETIPGEFGESLKYSLWVQRDGVSPFRPIYSVLPNYNTAVVPIVKQSEGYQGPLLRSSQSEARGAGPIDPDRTNILSTVMRTMNADGTPDKDGFLIFPNFVYESVYKNDVGGGGIVGWIPTRHRPIKTIQERPNYYITANSTWEMILNILENPKTIGEITENSLVFLMKKYLDFLKDPITKKSRARAQSAKSPAKITFEAWLAEYLKRPPNYYNSALESIWAQNATKNPLILPMTNMHNQVKSLLYQATTQAIGRTGLRLLELASGKSPDYIRWVTNNIDFVVGVEIDPIQIDAAIDRYKGEWKRARKQRGSKPPINVRYLQGDMTKDLRSGAAGKTTEDQEKLRQLFQFGAGRSKFDIVSCQFAMHFAMKDETTFTQFIKNVSLNLKPGGFFIGTSFIASRPENQRKLLSIGPGVHDRLAEIKTKIKTSTATSSTSSTSKHDLSYIDPATQETIWTIDRGSSFEPELKDFGQDILVYLSTLHQADPYQEYLVNLTSEKVIEIAAQHNLKLIQLPNSLIGHNGQPQAFGEVYDKIQKDEIKPVEMKSLDIKETLKQLLSNEKMADFSRFNSLFVFQK